MGGEGGSGVRKAWVLGERRAGAQGKQLKVTEGWQWLKFTEPGALLADTMHYAWSELSKAACEQGWHQHKLPMLAPALYL